MTRRTFQSLKVENFTVMIVVPATIKAQWRKELAQWGHFSGSIRECDYDLPLRWSSGIDC